MKIHKSMTIKIIENQNKNQNKGKVGNKNKHKREIQIRKNNITTTNIK